MLFERLYLFDILNLKARNSIKSCFSMIHMINQKKQIYWSKNSFLYLGETDAFMHFYRKEKRNPKLCSNMKKKNWNKSSLLSALYLEVIYLPQLHIHWHFAKTVSSYFFLSFIYVYNNRQLIPVLLLAILILDCIYMNSGYLKIINENKVYFQSNKSTTYFVTLLL